MSPADTGKSLACISGMTDPDMQAGDSADQDLAAQDQLSDSDKAFPTVPARTIQRHALTITGRFNMQGISHEYESGLELRNMRVACFDAGFARMREQPVTVEYDGRVYHPDLLVSWKDGRPNYLQEVKPLARLDQNWSELEAGYLAAEMAAAKRGWEFRIVTDVDLKTPAVCNAVYLLPFRQHSFSAADLSLAEKRAQDYIGKSIFDLVLSLASELRQRPKWTSVVFHLLATHRIAVDLNQLITPQSPLIEAAEPLSLRLGSNVARVAELIAERRKISMQQEEESRYIPKQDVTLLTPGVICYLKGTEVTLEQIIGANRVLVKSPEGLIRCDVSELEAPRTKKDVRYDKTDVVWEILSEDQRRIALRRREVLEPLAYKRGRSRKEVEDAALLLEIGPTKAYELIKRFEANPVTSSLVDARDVRADKGVAKSDRIRAIFEEVVRELALGNKKPTPTLVFNEMGPKLRVANLPVGKTTIREWLAAIDQRKLKKAYFSPKKSREVLDEIFGQYTASFPFEVLQIDTTWMDLKKVSSLDRTEEIGRAYLTVAIDVYSRGVPAFLLTLDPPSSYTIGQVMAMAILPKDEWFAARGITGLRNPFYGIPHVQHMDGGSEHDNQHIAYVAQEWGISTIFRPKHKASWGGHIERLLGTLAKKLKEVTGATFSNPDEQEEHHPRALEAVMTMADAESWLTTFFFEEYPNTEHSALGCSPIEMLAHGQLMTASHLGGGAPRICTNPQKLKRDVLPMKEVTVQEYGVRWDYCEYSDPAIDYWRFNPHPKGKKFIAHRDPKQINSILLLDPITKEHVEVPMKREVAPMTIIDLRLAKEYAEAEGWKLSPDTVLDAFQKRRNIEHSAKKTTLRARRAKERQHQDARTRAIQNQQREPALRPMPANTNDVPVIPDPPAAELETNSSGKASFTFRPDNVDLSKISRK